MSRQLLKMYSHPKTFWLPNFCRTSLTLFTEGEGRRIIPAWFPWLDVVIVSKSPSLQVWCWGWVVGCGWVDGGVPERLWLSQFVISPPPRNTAARGLKHHLSRPEASDFFYRIFLSHNAQRSCPVTVEVYIIELRAGNNQHQISQIIMAGCVGCGGRLGPFCYV